MFSPNKNSDMPSRRLAFFSILAGLVALSAVVCTINDIGITTDEPHYYESCLQEIAWFRQAIHDISNGEWGAPFSREVLDRYWNFQLIFNVHPPFYKLGSSLTLVLFERWLGTMGAYRLSPAIMFSILVGLLFFTVGRRYGLLSGFWAAAGFALMPRIFSDAHFGATDMPITFLWFASAVSFHRALESKRWALVFALVYGLALSTKFTAFVIPLPLAAYVILSRRFKESLWPVSMALIISPLLMIGLNPQWWHDTIERLSTYFIKSATRAEYLQIPTFYLGQQYNFYLPWHHPLVYTLFTVSPLVLTGFIYGFWRTVSRPLEDRWASHMLLHWLAIIVVMILPGSPGHDGVRLFLPSFAFLAVISAKGFSHFVTWDWPRLFSLIKLPVIRTKETVGWVLAGTMIIPAVVVLARLHPYELCYYNSLAWGIPGAYHLGMETTYWWDPFNDKACKTINETFPDSSAIFAKNSWHYEFLQRLGKIKPSLKFRKKNIGYLLQYCRQGNFTEQDWLLYRRGKPLQEFKLDGVRLWAIFKLPQATEEILAGLENSNDPESLYEKSVIYDMLGRNKESLLNLKKYLQYRPKNFQANMNMVSFLLKGAHPAEALECLNRVSDNIENPQLWNFNMGSAYFQSGKNEEAISYLKESLKYQKLDYSALATLGYIYFQMGKMAESAGEFELVLYTDPYDELALQMMGMICERLNNIDKAKYYYERLVKENPGQLEALIRLGSIEEKSGNLGEAVRHYLRVLQADSVNLEANFNLANLFAATGKANLAEQYYKKILRDHPNNTQTYLALAMFYLKDPHRQPEALKQFRSLVELMPEQANFIEDKYIHPLEAEISGGTKKR